MSKIVFCNGRLLFKRFFITIVISFNVIFSSSSNSIPFFTDQIGHSVYYLDISSKIMQSDKKYGTIMIDGTKNIPHGSYIMDNDFISDSLDQYNYFSWKQGDYLLRDLLLGTRYILTDSTIVTFNAQGRSFPGKNTLQGPSSQEYSANSLQNYYLDYKKKYELSNLNFGIFYHLEDVGLPINKYEHVNRSVESFHLGSNYNIFLNNFDFDINYSKESGLIDFNDRLIYTSDLIAIESKFKKGRLNFISKIYEKYFSANINDSLAIDNNISKQSFNLGSNFNNYYYMIGFDVYLKNIFFNFDIQYRLKKYKIKFYKKNVFSNYLSKNFQNFLLVENNSETKYLSLSYQNKDIFSDLTLFNSKFNNEANLGLELNSKFYYHNNFIAIKHVEKNNKNFMVNRFSNIKMYVEPYLFWTERYKFFFNIDYYYYCIGDGEKISLLDPFYSEVISNEYNDFFLNNEIGLIVGDFRLTYCNHFISRGDFTLSDQYLSIESISYFKVDWIFTD